MIGVVECVFGMVCYEIEVMGELDYVGMMLMDMWKDVFFVINNLIVEVCYEFGRLDLNLVYIMGCMNVLFNIYIVILNKVIFLFEVRYMDEDVIVFVEKII